MRTLLNGLRFLFSEIHILMIFIFFALSIFLATIAFGSEAAKVEVVEIEKKSATDQNEKAWPQEQPQNVIDPIVQEKFSENKRKCRI